MLLYLWALLHSTPSVLIYRFVQLTAGGEPVQHGLQCSVVNKRGQQHERVYFYTDHFNNIILPPVLSLH